MFGSTRNRERDIQKADRTGGPQGPHSEASAPDTDPSKLLLVPSLLLPEPRPQCKHYKSHQVGEHSAGTLLRHRDPTRCNLTHQVTGMFKGHLIL